MSICTKFKSHVVRIAFALIMVGLAPSMLSAQDKTVQGVVNDKSGEPMFGVQVAVAGTSRGTTTDFDGKFKLQIQDSDSVLTVSYVGYLTQKVKIGDKTRFNITLKTTLQLDEVVVTALGVERSEKSLGYSVQKVGSKEISSVKPVNVVNALAGKVSGVYVTGSAAGPTASSNITIRGQTSLSGSSQALFVVNGIPITNGLFSPGDGLNGSTTIDFGNSAQIVNPDDIESVSVLKGPAAAALYGTRAANGVILINTKTGADTKGMGVEINTTTTVETILRLPDYQNEYGFGGYGFYSYRDGTTYTGDYYDAFGENWGPRLDGRLIKQFNSEGQPAPYTSAEGNIRDFFRTGVTSNNNFAIYNSNETGDFRLSYTRLDRRGIVPNTNLQRNTFTTSMGKKLFNEKLDVRLNAMFVNSGSDNVPNAGYDESSSVMYGWLWYPRQVPINDLKDYWKPGQEGSQQRYVEELWVNNPWFVANENTNSFQANRIIGNLALNYEVRDNFNVRFRYGADVKDEQRQFRRATSTKGLPGQFGSYREDELSFTETNAELLFSYNTPRENKINLDLKAGGNVMRQRSNILSANNPQLLKPGLFTLTNNRSEILVDNPRAEKGINSVFGVATLSYDGLLYLEVTGRNDWSSTLPSDNNSFFYPSVSLTGILSDIFRVPTSSFLSFLKARTAYAQVGGDTNPYLLNNFYSPEPLFGSNPASSVSNVAANPNLRPERTDAFEFGIDARFADSRLGIDATFYSMLSRDQITFLPSAATSGRSTRLINGGEISNTGVEVRLYATPVKRDDFTWDLSLNFGHNRAIVEELPEGVEGNYPIVANVFPNDGGAGMELVAIKGEPLGQIWGLGFQRDDNGNIIHENGLPLMTEEKVSAGSYQPDARVGLNNTFSYGRISFGFLLDAQIGGKIYSRTHALMNTGGAITNNDDPLLNLSTLEGRSSYEVSYDADGNPVYSGTPGAGVVGPGVMYDDNGALVPNTESVATRDYFYAYYGNGFNRDNVEAATYDASYLKLRELRIAYQLPKSLAKRVGLQGASVSLVGRNLLMVTSVPSIDPETYSIRNGLFVNGYESTQLPSTRSFGVSLSVSL